MHYDLIVIGEDPDGLFRAMAAARDGARVAVVSDRSPSISMELLHEAVENVVDSSQGACEDWRAEIEYFLRCQREANRKELAILGVEWHDGVPRFVSANSIDVNDSGELRRISGTEFVVATGTKSRLPASLKEDGQFVVGIETLFDIRDPCLNSRLIPNSRVIMPAVPIDAFVCESASASGADSTPCQKFPAIAGFVHGLNSERAAYNRVRFGKKLLRSAIVVGAGKTGLISAIVLAKLGVEVTIVDEHETLFDVVDVFDDVLSEIESLQIAFRFGEAVIGTELRPDLQAAVRLTSGRTLTADVIVLCVGRIGRTDHLNLEAIGVGLDERGRIWCDENGQTWCPAITAAGNVIGFSRQEALPSQ